MVQIFRPVPIEQIKHVVVSPNAPRVSVVPVLERNAEFPVACRPGFREVCCVMSRSHGALGGGQLWLQGRAWTGGGDLDS